jgi:hypothetical protein
MPAAAAMLLQSAISDSESDELPAGDLPGLYVPAAEPAVEGRQASASLLESVGSVDAPGPVGGAAAHEDDGGSGLGAYCAALLANANLSQSVAPLLAGARQTEAAARRGVDGLTVLALTWNLHGAVPAESLQPLLRPGAYDVYAVGSQVGAGRIVALYDHTTTLYQIHNVPIIMTRKCYRPLLAGELRLDRQVALLLLEAGLASTHIAVFVRTALLPAVRNVRSASVATGVANIVKNKGAVGVSLEFAPPDGRPPVATLFVCAHRPGPPGAVKRP